MLKPSISLRKYLENRHAPRVTAIVSRRADGQCQVELPNVRADWCRTGARVWMSRGHGGVVLTPHPAGRRLAKRWSRGLRRPALTLARRRRPTSMPWGQKLSARHAQRCALSAGHFSGLLSGRSRHDYL